MVHLTHNKEDAEDLFIEVCNRVVKEYPRSYTGTDYKQFIKWCQAIARNMWLDKLRQKEAKKRVMASEYHRHEVSDEYVFLDTSNLDVLTKQMLFLLLTNKNSIQIKQRLSIGSVKFTEMKDSLCQLLSA